MYSRITSTLNGNQIEFPLKQVHMNVSVINLVAQYVVEQSFFNDEDQPLESHYTFPAPAGSTVNSFEARIDGKTIVGVLKDKDEARHEYNKAVVNGDGASLLERHDGDVFSTTIGNIPPKTEVLICIRYVLELNTEINVERVRLNIPLTIMPRYACNSVSSEKAEAVNPGKVNYKPYDMLIDGSIFMSDGLIELDSKTDKIQIKNPTKDSIEFTMDNFEKIDHDVIITIRRNRPRSMAVCAKSDSFPPKYRYCTMANIVPKVQDVDATKDIHYTLILDRSGSMSGGDLDNCKLAATKFITLLPVGSTFDLYHFGSNFVRYEPAATIDEGTIDHKRDAIRWIQSICINGGTEVYRVLRDAYDRIKQRGKRGAIILLSDGGVCNTDAVLALVKNNQHANVFTIGIGDSVSTQLMDGMAIHGNGKVEYISSNDKNIQEKVAAQLRRSQQSSKEMELTVDSTEYLQVPKNLPPLFGGDSNVVYIFSEEPIDQLAFNKESIPISYIESDSPHLVAGTKLMEDLKFQEYRWQMDADRGGSHIAYIRREYQGSAKDKIKAVSLDLGILSDYTSFVAIEIREEGNKTLGEKIFKETPLQAPNKWANLVNINKPLGINTVGQSLKNCSWDIRSSSACPKTMGVTGFSGSPGPLSSLGPQGCVGPTGPQGSADFSLFKNMINDPFDIDKILPSEVDDGWFDLEGATTFIQDNPWLKNFMSDHNISDENLDVELEKLSKIKVDALPEHSKFMGLLTSNKNEKLPYDVELDDIIMFTNSSGIIGFYRVVSSGSDGKPWVLELVHKKTA